MRDISYKLSEGGIGETPVIIKAKCNDFGSEYHCHDWLSNE